MQRQNSSWLVQGREVTESDLEWIRSYWQAHPAARRKRIAIALCEHWGWQNGHGHHYLGLRIVGENIGYLIGDRNGRDVAALLFGAAAWRCAARDHYIGWPDRQRRAGLSAVANNTRFLLLPWVKVPHLASHILGTIQRRIHADWQGKYGHGLQWLETFVDTGRFKGTCYRAANWREVGLTRGRTRQDREHRVQVNAKYVLLYALDRQRRSGP